MLAEGIGEFINIGTGEDIKIKDLAQMVKDIVGFEGELRWDTAKPDGAPRKLLDVSRIKTLGWEPKVSLNEGIKKTYEWYMTTKSTKETIETKETRQTKQTRTARMFKFHGRPQLLSCNFIITIIF
ncbi:MAG: hypothetical protein V2A69_13560 [Pseudomonadota bacterium]